MFGILKMNSIFQKKIVMNNNNVLRIHIKNSQPVDVSDFTKTMSAFGTLFSNFAQKNGKSKEEANAKLYVSKIIEGSIDIHLVELASLAVIPFVENSNLILEFAKHIKSIYDYFVLSKGDKPELNVPELKGVHDMVSIPANDRNGLMTVQVINDNAGNVIFEGCTFNHIEGNGIQNQSDNALKERKALSKTCRGKKNGGTWMHPILFIKFAMYLSPKFEYHVLKFVSDEMIRYRNDAGDAYKELSSAVMKIVPKDYMPKAMKKIGEALNWIIFNGHERLLRNKHGDESKQRELWQLEKKIADLINEGFITAFDPLIDYLRKLYEKKNNPAVFIPVA